MNINPIIVIANRKFEQLQSYLLNRDDVESMAVAFYHQSLSGNTFKLLVKDILLPTDDDYHQRSSGCVTLQPELLEQCFRYCEDNNCHLLDIHTHPWSRDISFSHIDDREALDTKIPYMTKYLPGTAIAFLVMGATPQDIQARLWHSDSKKLVDIQKVVII